MKNKMIVIWGSLIFIMCIHSAEARKAQLSPYVYCNDNHTKFHAGDVCVGINNTVWKYEVSGSTIKPKELNDKEVFELYRDQHFILKDSTVRDVKFAECTAEGVKNGDYCMDEKFELYMYVNAKEKRKAPEYLKKSVTDYKMVDKPKCGKGCGRCSRAIEGFSIQSLFNMSGGRINTRDPFKNSSLITSKGNPTDYVQGGKCHYVAWHDEVKDPKAAPKNYSATVCIDKKGELQNYIVSHESVKNMPVSKCIADPSELEKEEKKPAGSTASGGHTEASEEPTGLAK